MRHVTCGGLTLVLLLVAGTALATGMMIPTDEKVPPLAVKYLRVGTAITDGVATTKVEQVFINSTNRQLEANFVFPLPKDAAIAELAIYINGKRITAELIDAPKARKIYEDIVRRALDPALLEYMGNELFRLRVFPIPPNGEQRVELEYSQTLDYDAGLYKFVYPLRIGERFSATLEDFSLSATIESKVPITSIYSPSHTIGIDRVSGSGGDHEAIIGFEQEKAALNRDFVLYYGISQKNFGLNMLTHRLEDESGYFMLLVSPRHAVDEREIVKKDVVFVFDTSGSMAGEKIEQARRALTFCVNSLNEGDRFNVVQFATTVNAYRSELVDVSDDSIKAARTFIAELDATGGTDINAALTTALGMKPKEGARPFMIVFLTDGKPTIGETQHEAIINNVAAANAESVRIFVFGVGYEVNTHLLDRVAQENHGTSDYVDPTEDIEVKVSSFFAKVSHPVLANVQLAFGEVVRVYDLYPREMPDLFKGVPLQVFGRYSGAGDVAITLSGEVNGEKRSFTYETTFAKNLNENTFIAPLWATRRVGYLLDEIRLHGENPELVDSVRTLARTYGIVTPYTSYLIVEDDPVRRNLASRGRTEVLSVGYRSARTRAGEPEEADSTDSSLVIGGSELPGESRESEAKGSSPGKTLDATDVAAGVTLDLDDDVTVDELVGATVHVWTARNGGSIMADGEEAVALARELGRLKQRATAKNDKSAAALRNVGRRNFYRIADTWVDGTMRADMPTLKVKYASDAYFALLTWRPELKQFLAIGDKLILVVDDHLIVIGEAGEETLTKEAFDEFLTSTADTAE